ncbi:hypothetical protein ACH4Q6_07210 [Streptomyces lydicus]|uniref:hypothetical protein n=1 Tax=Streptomyces lydicus TaxID=47763 RepID=UPI003794EC92
MRPPLRRCLVLAALGGVSVLACGAAEAAPRTMPVHRPADGAGPGRSPLGGQFDPVVGRGGGVLAGGGELLVSRAGGR